MRNQPQFTSISCIQSVFLSLLGLKIPSLSHRLISLNFMDVSMASLYIYRASQICGLTTFAYGGKFSGMRAPSSMMSSVPFSLSPLALNPHILDHLILHTDCERSFYTLYNSLHFSLDNCYRPVFSVFEGWLSESSPS